MAYVEAHKVGEEHLAAQRCGGGVRDRGRHVREAAVLAPNQVREGAVLAFCAASRAEEAAGGSEDCTGLLCLLSLLELELLGLLLPLGLLELELEKPLAQRGLVHRFGAQTPARHQESASHESACDSTPTTQQFRFLQSEI